MRRIIHGSFRKGSARERAMGGAAAGAAAAAAQARKRVIAHFVTQDAVSPQSAVPFTPGRAIEGRMFERLRNADILLPGRNGGYYLDAPKYAAWMHRQNVRALWVVAMTVVVTGVAVAVAVLLGQQ